jgi:RNA polymerase sigma-70 factor, ECF subfamily
MNFDESTIRAAQKDVEAFSLLIDECYGTIFRIAMKYSVNRSDAEDIAQNAAVKLAQVIGQYQFKSEFTTWLYRIVVNCAYDWQRSQKRHNLADMLELSDTGSVDDSSAEQQIYLQQLMGKISSWGDGYRDVVILVMGEGLSHAETAEVLKVKESTVSWRIHEVKKRLSQIDGRGGAW